MFWVIQFYRLTQLIFFQHYLRALSAKNANHLQTTDTIKRHQRYSIHYHCGWPSLGIWGLATHYGLPALPEPFLRACGLHNMMFRVILCIQFYRLTQLIFSTLLNISMSKKSTFTWFFSLKSLYYQWPFVSLKHENSPSLSTMLKCAGLFLFL